MKILYVSNSVLPSKWANSVHVMKMCAGFAAQGAKVRLLAKPGSIGADLFDHYAVEPKFEIELISEPRMGRLGRIVYARRIRTAARSGDCHQVVYGRDLGGLVACASLGKPLVFETHHIHPGRLARLVIRWLLKRENLLFVVVISTELKKDLLGVYPWLDPSRILVAHDAADPPVGIEAQVGQRTASLFNVSYIGHLYPGKGMEVVEQVAGHLPDIRFNIVGGTDEDIRAWKSRCDTGDVVFYGHVAPASLREHFELADVCLLPIQRRVSLQEGKGDIGRWTSPLKLFEYMSYGKAIVASDVPVLREVLENGVNAILVPADDFVAWREAIERLRRDPGLRMRLGERARSDFLQNHTWGSRARLVLEEIERRGTVS